MEITKPIQALAITSVQQIREEQGCRMCNCEKHSAGLQGKENLKPPKPPSLSSCTNTDLPRPQKMNGAIPGKAWEDIHQYLVMNSSQKVKPLAMGFLCFT